MKTPKSKLKTNQIQVITGDDYLQFFAISIVHSCTFPLCIPGPFMYLP